MHILSSKGDQNDFMRSERSEFLLKWGNHLVVKTYYCKYLLHKMYYYIGNFVNLCNESRIKGSSCTQIGKDTMGRRVLCEEGSFRSSSFYCKLLWICAFINVSDDFLLCTKNHILMLGGLMIFDEKLLKIFLSHLVLKIIFLCFSL